MRRDRIIAAARALFHEKGYEAASTREIAHRADVGTGTLFDYAPDKHALLMMVFYEDLDRLTVEAYATLPSHAPLIKQLMHMFAPRLAVWGADLRLSRYAARETFARFTQPASEAHPRRSLLHGTILAIVRAAQERREITSAVNATDIARLFIVIYLTESREWVQEDDADLARAATHLERLLTISINGITL
ncbi:MAG TPA: helix-turn-helix domain-containing protein [Candidatus Lustribacter sp.]